MPLAVPEDLTGLNCTCAFDNAKVISLMDSEQLGVIIRSEAGVTLVSRFSRRFSVSSKSGDVASMLCFCCTNALPRPSRRS